MPKKDPPKPKEVPKNQPKPEIPSKNNYNKTPARQKVGSGKPKTNNFLPNGKKKYSEVYEGPDRNLVENL